MLDLPSLRTGTKRVASGRAAWSLALLGATALGACGSSSNTAASGAGASSSAADAASGVGADGATGTQANPPGAACNGSVASAVTAGPAPPAAPALTIPAAFTLSTVAAVTGARQLAALPNGDLLVATSAQKVYLVPDAEASGAAGAPVTFTTIADSPVQGIAFAGPSCMVFVASQHGVYALPYVDGQRTAASGTPIAKVRQGNPTPGSDGDVHTSTSVGVTGGKVYAGVGSGCNACVEVDPTRATIQEMDLSGANLSPRATRFRNAIAIATNPTTGTLWAGGAGQDSLAVGHPYEFFDAVTLHSGVADYGWPDCEEDHVAYTAGASCSSTVQPLVELPAYSTIIGATFYPTAPAGAHAFPGTYRGGAFLAAHGSWHTASDGSYYSPPRVVFVPMNGDAPQINADWTDPTKQWTEFIGGFQQSDGRTRVGRPTGLAVGSQGSLFVADDQSGLVYRVRPK
jgi:glucose/arabinose dehydrogenase